MPIFIFKTHGHFTSHLRVGQGKARPENGKVDENVKFWLPYSKADNLRSGWSLKNWWTYWEVCPKDRPYSSRTHWWPFLGHTWQQSNRWSEERGSFLLHKGLRMVAWKPSWSLGYLLRRQISRIHPLLHMLVWNVWLAPCSLHFLVSQVWNHWRGMLWFGEALWVPVTFTWDL